MFKIPTQRLSLALVCALFVSVHALTNRPHDFSNFTIRLVPNESFGKRNIQDATLRRIREAIDSRIDDIAIEKSQTGIVVRDQRSIDEIQYLLDTTGQNIYHIEETYKTSPDYLRYMNQGGTPVMSYHNYTQLYDFLTKMNNQYPDMTSLFSIGKSNQGREQYGIRINTKSRAPVPQNMDMNIPLPKPKFKYIGNIHGDETVGREILIKLVETLLEQYNATNPRIKKLLDSIDLYIIPSMNPDGYEAVTRENKNRFDLNRNFPDHFVRNTMPRQVETTNMMNWLGNHSFVLSACLHGGAVVANYPWDGLPSGRITANIESKSPDDAFFKWVSKIYANNHKTMRSSGFPGGITNGAGWYTLYGGMQDYNYVVNKCPEITVEVSTIKNPPAVQLINFWQENEQSLYAYMEIVYSAIAGSIIEYPSGKAVQVPCNMTFASDSKELNVDGLYSFQLPIPVRDQGFYYKLLYPGVLYNMTLECVGYPTMTELNVPIPVGTTNPTVRNWIVSSSRVCVPYC